MSSINRVSIFIKKRAISSFEKDVLLNKKITANEFRDPHFRFAGESGFHSKENQTLEKKLFFMKFKMNSAIENEQVAGHAKAQTVGGKRVPG